MKHRSLYSNITGPCRMKFMFITLWYSQLCLCPTALGRGNFLLFIGLTSSLINLILVLCIPLSIPMPFYFFRVCNQWHNSAVELQKLKLSACVMLITQGLGVAYILERVRVPLGLVGTIRSPSTLWMSRMYHTIVTEGIVLAQRRQSTVLCSTSSHCLPSKLS